MSRTRGVAVGCVLIGVIGLSPALVRADEAAKSEAAEARSHYEQGQRAYVAKRYAEAALHFEAAGQRAPHASAWYMAAEAWDHASQFDKAADALSRALEAPGLTDDLREKMSRRLAELEQTLGTIVVDGQSNYSASLDGAFPVAPPGRMHAQPGTHALTIIPPEKPSFRRDLVVGAGERKTIALDAEAKTEEAKTEAAAPQPVIRYVDRVVDRPVPRPAEPRKYVGFGVLGLGVASTVGAIAFGASALDARDAYRSMPTQEGYDHARGLQTTTNIAWTLAAASLVTGAVLLFWPSGSAK